MRIYSVAVGWALTGLLYLAPVANAQAPASPSGDASSTTLETPEYKRTIEEALKEYGLGHFEEARSLFEHAHALYPNARTERGLGMVEFELRHYVRAEELLKSSLNNQQKPLTPEQRKAVEELLVRAGQFTANYTLSVEPARPGILIELDGKAVSTGKDAQLSLEAGEHVLRVSAPDTDAKELHIDVKGGESQTLRVVLEVKSESPAVVAAAQPQVDDEPSRPFRKPGILLVSAGGGVLVAGGVLGVLALSKANDADTRHDSSADSARTLALVSDIVIGVGAATAVTGIVLMTLRGKPKERATQALRLMNGGSGLKVSF